MCLHRHADAHDYFAIAIDAFALCGIKTPDGEGAVACESAADSVAQSAPSRQPYCCEAYPSARSYVAELYCSMARCSHSLGAPEEGKRYLDMALQLDKTVQCKVDQLRKWLEDS